MTIIKNILNTVSSKKSFFIPAGMTVRGTFTVNVPGRIAGSVNGDVIVNGSLIILKTAVIRGNVRAEELDIFGSVTGDIQCSGKMTLQNTCLVKGNISTAEIYIEKDAVVDGIITKSNQSKTEQEFTSGTLHEPGIQQQLALNRMEDEEVQSWF